MSLASAMQGCIYLEQIFRNIDNYQYGKTKIYEDNQDIIALAKNSVNRQRIKHMYQFIRETINSGKVILEYCPTDQMVADILTKPTTKMKLKNFAQHIFGTETCCFCFHSKWKTCDWYCF